MSELQKEPLQKCIHGYMGTGRGSLGIRGHTLASTGVVLMPRFVQVVSKFVTQYAATFLFYLLGCGMCRRAGYIG